MRALLVDDDHELARLLREYLTPHGVSVDHIDDGGGNGILHLRHKRLSQQHHRLERQHHNLHQRPQRTAHHDHRGDKLLFRGAYDHDYVRYGLAE